MKLYINEQEVVIALGVLTFLGTQANRWLKAHLSPKQLSTAHQLAITVVQAAEEAGKAANLTGAQKYGIAEPALMDLAKRVGLTLSQEEAHALIHSALADFKAVTGAPAFPVAPPAA